MASNAERIQLENRIHELLLKNGDGILLNSFWSNFQSVYREIPSPKKYGLTKRNHLLSLFPSVCHVDDEHVNPRRVWVKVKEQKKTSPTATADVTESAAGLLQPAVGETAAQLQEQKVKVKQSQKKLIDHTDNVANPKSKVKLQRRVPKHNPIAQKENESAGQSSGNPGKLIDSRPERPPPSTKGKTSEASKSATDQVDRQSDPRSLREPAKMTSNNRENTHIRFDDDAGDNKPPMWQQVPPLMLPPQPRAGPQHMAPRPLMYPPMDDYNRGYPPLSHVPQSRPRWQVRPLMPQLQQRVSDERMKNVVEDSIDRLVESKQYVSVERIEKLIAQHFQVSNVGELGFHSIDSIPAMRDHQRMLCKVNAYIQAFVKVRSIATVFELGECLKEYAGEGRDFDSLRLGPLVTQPLVYEFFKMPSDADVPSVLTEEIFEHLRGFLGANNLWADRNVQLEDFMKYLTEKYDVDTPFKLGIRIRSMPLLIGVLKKAQRECGKSMGTIATHIRETIEGDLGAAVKRFIATLVHKEPGICMIRQQCLEMNAPQLLGHVFDKFTVLMDFINELLVLHPTGGLKKVTRHCRNIQSFLQVFSKDELIVRLFHFVVCCSNQDMHSQLTDILTAEYQQLKPSQQGEERSRKELPPLDEVVKNMRKYLERCLMHGALSLANLARVEEKVLEVFGLPHFTDLGRGSFLRFLHDNSDIKQFLDECGGMTLGGSSVGTAAESAFHPSLNALLEFVHQSGMAANKVQHCSLEGAMCNHYRVNDVKSLGHGSVAHLVTTLEKQTKQNQESIVFYEGALCTVKTVFNTAGQVGPLGHVTKEKALACLQSCPLLENMSEWSHWEVVFRPELGDLKDFLHKYGGVRTIHVDANDGAKVQMVTSVLALETSPGTLLRVSSNTSPEAFATAAAAADVAGTCGHLVSLVVANRGMSNMPQALLANHMMTALLKINGRHSQNVSETPGGDDSGSCDVAQFVLDCLVKLPLIICEAVANQMLLEPLSKVVGSAKSKALLLRLAHSGAAQTRLQLLGCLLGLADWTTSFQARCSPPTGGITATPGNSFDDAVEVLESCDESEDDHEDDDPILVLSDEDDDVVEKGEDATTPVDAIKTETTDDSEGSGSVIKLSDTDDDNVMLDVSSDMVVKVERKGDPEGIVCLDDNPCWTVVEQIRRDEFGIGVALGEDGERLMRKQQERLGRSLDRLSRDLYSKDTHFVLELIQNADDNDYPPEMLRKLATTVPSVKFVVESDCITVFNNECGFEEKNIRAVCDVGRSTKGKHKYGYIGQKGIGFKSVFRVTDRPEIHSNGFHICFDVKSSPMGYVLPHWIDDTGNTKDVKSWTTRIELPLKDEMRSQTQCRSLAARFHDVHPSLLLFLHRLKHLTVHNTVEGVTMNIERRDLGNGVVEIRHDNSVDRWLVVKHTLDASAISLQAKSGVEVESTEVALAFPLSTQGKLAHTQPGKQGVFAYLPLRSYGFRFVIQGDFDVPASREDVDRDSLWNQWLRSEMHSLFVDALQRFKTHPEFSELEAVRYFTQFIPLEDEILEFFRPVASAILQQLRSEPCLPTEGASGTGMLWKMPSQLVLTKDPLVRDVITSSLLRETLGLDFLHKDVASMLNPSLMQSLGVQVLTTSHLVEIGKVIVSRLSAPIGSFSIPARQAAMVDLAKWLVCVYRSLDEFDYNEELMAKLKTVVKVPLITGDVVSMETTTVFFPIDSAEQLRLSKTNTAGPLTALMCDLSMLMPNFLGSLDKVSNSQLGRLLETLGVKHLQAQDIIQHHIMPTLRSDQWQKRPERLLVSYFVYLKQQWDQNPSVVDMNELRPIAVVKTQKGPRRPADAPVHFSQLYGNKINLPQELPGYDWQLLHDCYQKSGGSPWREFFTELGVLDFLSVREKVITVTPSELESTPWAPYKAMLPAADVYKITDYECVEFAALAHSCSAATQCEAMHRQMQTLFALLDQQWDAKYSKYATTQITDSHGYVLRQDVDTSFAILLKSSPWLPTCVMCVSTANNMFTVTQSREIKVGRDLFVRVPAISHLLGDHVPYLEATPAPNSSFPPFLGIQNSIKVEFVVGLLKGWCERKTGGAPRPFNTSMDHIKAIYRYLSDTMPPKQLQDLVHECPIIFVPSDRPPNSSTKVDGVFLGRSELRWDDPSGLFAGYRDSLAGSDSANAYRLTIRPIYQDMEDFFLQCARVVRAPELTDFAQLLVHIAMTVPLPKALPDALRIFTIIGNMFTREPDLVKVRMAELTQVLQTSSGAIPVKGGRWVAQTSRPMVADDKVTERLFSGKEGVNFVDLGDRLGTGMRGRSPATVGIDRDLVLRCLRELGIHPLSECLAVDYQTEMYQPCPQLQLYVHNVLPLVQVLLCKEFPTVYDELIADNIAEKIKAMRFVKVGRLELVYSLKHKPEIVNVLNEKCRLVDDRELCIHREHVTNLNEVNKELARYFSRENMPCRNEIRDLLLELLPLVDNPSRELQAFVKGRGLDDLPETEERWQVEEPVIYHPPPRSYTPQQFEERYPVAEGQGQQDHGNQDNSGGLRAWPPRSGDPDLRQRQGSGGGGGRQMWPPPAPPEGVDYTSLPASLRPSKLPSVKPEGTTSHPHGDGAHVSRPRTEGATKTEGEPGHMTGKGVKREPQAEGNSKETETRAENKTPANVNLVDVQKQVDVPNATVNNASSGDTSQDAQQMAPMETEDAKLDVEGGDEIATPPKKRRRSETFDVLHQRPITDWAVWLQDSETPYEHVDIGTLVLPDGMAPADGDHNAEVGRWGEQLVYSYLRQAARDANSRIVSVSWTNEDQETGGPFDFVVTMKNTRDPSKDLTVFIEVKSTSSDTKNFFEMSLQQIDFAREKTDTFHLYRVFNAGHQAAVRLMRLENLALKLERKEVRLCMFV